MRRGVLLILLFTLFSSILSDPSACGSGPYVITDCFLAPSPECDALTVADLPLKCNNPVEKFPTNDVIATINAGTGDTTYWNTIGLVYGNTFTNYTQLNPGSTYYFSTCRLSDGGNVFTTELEGFDPAIIIRDPNGNFITGNSYCYSCDANFDASALVEYTHPASPSYSYIYVSVVYDPFVNGDANCYRKAIQPVTLYHRIETTLTCTNYLSSTSTSVNLASTVPLTLTTASLYNSNLCGGVTVTTNVTSVDCSNVGTVYVQVTGTLSSVSQSVVSTVTLSDSVTPTITCNPYIILDGNYQHSGYCSHYYDGTISFCAVPTRDLPFSTGVIIADNCLSYLHNSFTISPSNVFPDLFHYVSAGDVIKIDYVSKDSKNTATKTCSLKAVGAYIFSIVSGQIIPPYYPFDVEFYASVGTKYDTAYLILSFGSQGTVYDYFDHKIYYESYSNIDSYAIDSISVSSSFTEYVFPDVEFDEIFDINTFYLVVVLANSSTQEYILSYANPIIVIESDGILPPIP